jgi:hypothetical protein
MTDEEFRLARRLLTEEHLGTHQRAAQAERDAKFNESVAYLRQRKGA